MFHSEWILSLQQKSLEEIRQLLREAPLEESRKRELSSALHVYFRDWLYGNYQFLPFRPNVSGLFLQVLEGENKMSVESKVNQTSLRN